MATLWETTRPIAGCDGEVTGMKKKDLHSHSNSVSITNGPIEFDEKVCDGCNKCVEICVRDILVPSEIKGMPPVVAYPEECWYDGLCLLDCPLREQGAIRLNHPVSHKVRWKRKATGEHFRIGMSNPPPPNTKPPSGGWEPKA
jgi:NAD-dependent dihydropyrimidine dehydrogenase PreA subunit